MNIEEKKEYYKKMIEISKEKIKEKEYQLNNIITKYTKIIQEYNDIVREYEEILEDYEIYTGEKYKEVS